MSNPVGRLRAPSRRGFLAGAAALAASPIAKSQSLPSPALISQDVVIGRGRYASPCDGMNSDSAAFNLAVQDITDAGANPGNVRIYLPTQICLTEPVPPLDVHQIVGLGSTSTKVWVRGPVTNQLFHFDGRNGFYGGGCRGFGIEQTEHTAGIYFIRMAISSTGTAPANNRFEDLRLGGGSNPAWAPFRCFEMVGSPDTVPAGLRELTFDRITCFGSASGVSIYMSNLIACDVDNMSAFPGSTGAAFYAVNCWKTRFQGLNLQGGIVRNGNTQCIFIDKSGSVI